MMALNIGGRGQKASFNNQSGGCLEVKSHLSGSKLPSHSLLYVSIALKTPPGIVIIQEF